MSFISRILNHVLNEVVVERLAHSKTFQRAAIGLDEMLKKGGDTASKQSQELKEKATQQGNEFLETFKAEMAKGFEELEKSAEAMAAKKKPGP